MPNMLNALYICASMLDVPDTLADMVEFKADLINS